MKKAVALLICLSSFGCEETRVERPEDLIPENVMVSILHDIAILNAAKETSIDVLEAHDIEPSRFVLKQYGIDSLQFVNSDLYYASRPRVYERIYAAVKERLDQEKKELDERREKQLDSAAEGGPKRTSPTSS